MCICLIIVLREERRIKDNFIDNTMILRKFFLKNWRMRILSAVFFLSLLAGKFKILRNDKLAHPVYINVFKVTGFPVKVL